MPDVLAWSCSKQRKNLELESTDILTELHNVSDDQSFGATESSTQLADGKDPILATKLERNAGITYFVAMPEVRGRIR